MNRDTKALYEYIVDYISDKEIKNLINALREYSTNGSREEETTTDEDILYLIYNLVDILHYNEEEKEQAKEISNWIRKEYQIKD